MNTYELSVIVPVYNCKKYLDNSLISLINQTIFDKLEIILVDDGSTDGGWNVLEQYAKEYKNIYAYHQENRGVSSARNAGLYRCRGDFVAFFDADDYAEPELYETMLKLIKEENADISIVNYCKFFSDGKIIRQKKEEKKIWNNREELVIDFFKENRICTNPVDKLFRANIAKNIKFPEGFSIGEDMYFVYQALCCAEKVVLDTRNSLYRYYIREGSAMKSRFSEKMLDPMILMKKIMSEYDQNSDSYVYAEAKYYNEVCKALSLLTRDDPQEYYSTRCDLRNELKKYHLRKAYKYMSRKHFMAVVIMRLSPFIYNKIYDFLRIG